MFLCIVIKGKIEIISLNGMHVAFVNHSYIAGSSPEALVHLHFTSKEWAKAIKKAGARVTVFYRFHSNTSLQLDGVNYVFLADKITPQIKVWQPAYAFHKKVRKLAIELKVDILHAHNALAFGANWSLRTLFSQWPVIIQDHVATPRIKRPLLLRYSLRKANAVLFSAKGQDHAWIDRKILKPEQVHHVMEHSSPFRVLDRSMARKLTGLYGEPIFLWVGNLNSNKDPITALKAFERLMALRPKARLYMIYKEADLEQEVCKYISNSEILSGSVKMLGQRKREELEQYYNSADYYLSASYKEGSGYAAIEAMSCGVVPILSEIPSFRALLKGKVGGLFPPGDDLAMAKAMERTMTRDLQMEHEQVRKHFDEFFSFEAMGKEMMLIYQDLIANHMKKST